MDPKSFEKKAELNPTLQFFVVVASDATRDFSCTHFTLTHVLYASASYMHLIQCIELTHTHAHHTTHNRAIEIKLHFFSCRDMVPGPPTNRYRHRHNAIWMLLCVLHTLQRAEEK